MYPGQEDIQAIKTERRIYDGSGSRFRLKNPPKNVIMDTKYCRLHFSALKKASKIFLVHLKCEIPFNPPFPKGEAILLPLEKGGREGFNKLPSNS
jgi:hypothetical protein